MITTQPPMVKYPSTLRTAILQKVGTDRRRGEQTPLSDCRDFCPDAVRHTPPAEPHEAVQRE